MRSPRGPPAVPEDARGGRDPVGRGLARLGGHLQHPAGRGLAAAAPARRPAAVRRRLRRAGGDRGCRTVTLNRRMTVTAAVACVLGLHRRCCPLFKWLPVVRHCGAGAVIVGRRDPARSPGCARCPSPACLAAGVARPAALPEPGLRGAPLAAVGHPHARVARPPVRTSLVTGLSDSREVRAARRDDLPGLAAASPAGGVGIAAVLADLIAVAAAVHRAGRAAAARPVSPCRSP